VLRNLIDNAVKYSSRHPQPVVSIRNLDSNTEWVLIVSLHGGRIWAESGVNQGARFFIALPLQPMTRQGNQFSAAL
jgi:signal transduction histidine kinase